MTDPAPAHPIIGATCQRCHVPIFARYDGDHELEWETAAHVSTCTEDRTYFGGHHPAEIPAQFLTATADTAWDTGLRGHAYVSVIEVAAFRDGLLL